MWFTRVSINNPVFATMVMVAIMVLGLFSYMRLPVEQMRYVLPGARISWVIDAPKAKGSDLARTRVVGSSDRGNFDAQAAVEARP